MLIMRKNVSLIAKCLTFLTSFSGIILGFFFYEYDGYSHWHKRLLYFTTQSNIWIGTTMLILVIFSLMKRDDVWVERLYLLKYFFTVSITITGLVFCTLLAPFADETYHAWSPISLLTHVITPVLAIADFFIDGKVINFKKRHVLYTAVAPLLYFVFVTILGAFNVDFGKGEPFPYFFLNYNSPAGMFGFSKEPLALGSAYFIILFIIMVLGFGLLYAKLHKRLNGKLNR